VRGCAISADGRWIVSASWDTTLKIWEAETGQELRTLSGHTAEVNGCAISADGRWIASASSDKTLKVWDSYQGSSITTLYTDDRFTSCVWHPDGMHLVATGVQGVYFLQMIW
jgi:WD40 repeat protein